MKYLIDSDYVADYLSARPQATELLTTLTKEGTTISLITFGEIYEGIYYGHDPQKTKDVFNRFLRFVDILPNDQTNHATVCPYQRRTEANRKYHWRL